VVSQLSGRYAAALFDLARDERVLDGVAEDLGRLQAMLADSEDLRRLVRSPLISREDQAKAMAAILEKAEISDLVRRFVGVLARNRRLFALDAVIRTFFRLLAEHRGEVAAEVTSAAPLSEGQLEAVKGALARAVGSEVDLTAKVDRGLIGGLVVRVGSRMVDSSLRTKLQRLQFAMKGVG
jgi:F-type H+-transporting ATPase subunit delta